MNKSTKAILKTMLVWNVVYLLLFVINAIGIIFGKLSEFFQYISNCISTFVSCATSKTVKPTYRRFKK